jgi:hypothetical protein
VKKEKPLLYKNMLAQRLLSDGAEKAAEDVDTPGTKSAVGNPSYFEDVAAARSAFLSAADAKGADDEDLLVRSGKPTDGELSYQKALEKVRYSVFNFIIKI